MAKRKHPTEDRIERKRHRRSKEHKKLTVVGPHLGREEKRSRGRKHETRRKRGHRK